MPRLIAIFLSFCRRVVRQQPTTSIVSVILLRHLYFYYFDSIRILRIIESALCHDRSDGTKAFFETLLRGQQISHGAARNMAGPIAGQENRLTYHQWFNSREHLYSGGTAKMTIKEPNNENTSMSFN